MAEFQLPKLTTRVRFPSSAPVCALIAQSVERFHGKEEVIGSIPIKSSKAKTFVIYSRKFLFFYRVFPILK